MWCHAKAEFCVESNDFRESYVSSTETWKTVTGPLRIDTQDISV